MNRWLTFAIFIAAVVLSIVFAFIWHDPYGRLISWFVVAGGVVAAVSAFSPSGGSLSRGVLIDERNRYSQPALITISWFVVIVSAYLACAIWNVALWIPSPTNPLPVEISSPPEIWVLAGIVGVDLIAANVILNQKTRRVPSLSHEDEAHRLGLTTSAGTLFVRPRAAEAQLLDLVAYDELAVQETPDLAALQKLLFQITAVIVYAVALGRLIFSTPVGDSISQFPAIPEGFLALLGVSTATAIVNRTIPR